MVELRAGCDIPSQKEQFSGQPLGTQVAGKWRAKAANVSIRIHGGDGWYTPVHTSGGKGRVNP